MYSFFSSLGRRFKEKKGEVKRTPKVCIGEGFIKKIKRGTSHRDTKWNRGESNPRWISHLYFAMER